MLRFLSIVFFCFSMVTDAQDIKYEEPDPAIIEHEQRSVGDALDQANQLMKDGTVDKLLAQGRAALQSVQPHALSQPLQLPPYLQKERDDLYMARVLSAAESTRTANAAGGQTKQPIAFVSFSMPESQIKALMQEAKTIGATVALRGLINDDFKETFITLRQLAGELDSGLIIDPTLFKRFAVSTVPTFVLPLDSVQRCEKHNCPVPEFVKASGSATFQYFLDLVARVGSDREKTEAALWLENYGR